MIKNIFKKIYPFIFVLILFPSLVFATVIYDGYGYDWLEIVAFSLLVLTIMILIWIVSPLGVAFILCSLAQFIVQNKAVKIVAWIFQPIIFIFTFLLGILGVFWNKSAYGEGEYIILISVIGATGIICLSLIGTIIAQIIWQRKK